MIERDSHRDGFLPRDTKTGTFPTNSISQEFDEDLWLSVTNSFPNIRALRIVGVKSTNHETPKGNVRSLNCKFIS